MFMLHRFAPALATFTLLLPMLASGQTFDDVRLLDTAPGQNVGLAGAAVHSGPSYSGASSRRTGLAPLLNYQWANGWFAGTSHGVGYNASSTPGLQFGPRLTLDFGRKESRSSTLRGMGDVDPSLELGGFVNYRIAGALRLTAALRAGAGDDHKGVRLDLGVGHGFELARGLRLNLGVASTVANQAMLQSYFGVTAAQAARSGYAVFTPKAGLQDVRAHASLAYSVAPRTTLTFGISTTQLLGDAKASPLVRKATSTGAVAAVVYAF